MRDAPDQIALNNAIAAHGAYAVVRACDLQMHGHNGAMEAIGLPKPASMGDVVRMMWAAQDAMTPAEAAVLARKDALLGQCIAMVNKTGMGLLHPPAAARL